MKKILRRLMKFLAYTAATVVILLAIAVGLFRLFLPQVPRSECRSNFLEWTRAGGLVGQS
jgi:uncharacterized protein YhdP